jgi:hypothetical protein
VLHATGGIEEFKATAILNATVSNQTTSTFISSFDSSSIYSYGYWNDNWMNKLTNVQLSPLPTANTYIQLKWRGIAPTRAASVECVSSYAVKSVWPSYFFSAYNSLLLGYRLQY